MFVRGSLAGALILAPKRSGEAYDPEERALLTEIAQRVGLALDALQTLALRRELELRAPAGNGLTLPPAPPATGGAARAF
jgi:GAF domain-containing protein